jgi:hypothetical protein
MELLPFPAWIHDRGPGFESLRGSDAEVNKAAQKFRSGCSVVLAGPARAPTSPLPPQATDPESGAGINPVHGITLFCLWGGPKPLALRAAR